LALAACAHQPAAPAEVHIATMTPPPGPPDRSYRPVSRRALGRRLTGGPLKLPDAVTAREKGRKIAWTAMVYVEPDGTISRVDVVNPLPGADETIVEAVRGWRFEPQPDRRRTLFTFMFDF
jgi:hypothetical protein